MNKITTTITNLTDDPVYVGFIPPHGTDIASGASIIVQGDLYTILQARRKGTYLSALTGLTSGLTPKLSVVVNLPSEESSSVEEESSSVEEESSSGEEESSSSSSSEVD